MATQAPEITSTTQGDVGGLGDLGDLGGIVDSPHVAPTDSAHVCQMQLADMEELEDMEELAELADMKRSAQCHRLEFERRMGRGFSRIRRIGADEEKTHPR